jgi:multiple antibiotic resistance protein
MDVASIIKSSLYFLALINPISKVFLLSTMDPPYSQKQLFAIGLRSTLVALGILVALSIAGNFILSSIFHIQIYSLKIAGGFILFIVGLTAVRKGKFFEETDMQRVFDISVVPLAAPLIAGPGTITAAISFASLNGYSETILCICLALFVNFLVMIAAKQIGDILEKINITGPLVRITGLIVTAVAVQMILTGIQEWIHEIGS